MFRNTLRTIYHKIASERARTLISLIVLLIRRAKRAGGIDLLRAQAAMFSQGEVFTFFEDGLATTHNCDFLSDPRFLRALAVAEKTNSWNGSGIRWRAYIVCWLSNFVLRLPGDFVECGVNKGGFARLIIEYAEIANSGKRVYLFDTFKGFVPELLRPEEAGLLDTYNYADCLAEVQETFSPFPFVDLVPGPVPETLSSREIKAVCFLSIDMNCVEPEIAAAEFFWPKMTSGAVIILDDYGFSLHIAQKIAFDLFAEKHGVSVLSLPTGQGVIFKP
jgi:O-methyltransferase